MIEAAADLFYRRGYQATSVEDVLAATGIARSNFYYHFAGKRKLAREVVRHRIAEYDRDLVEPTLGDLSLSPAERLRGLFACADGSQELTVGRIGCPLGALAVELAQHDGEVQAVLSDYFARLKERLAETIAEGIAQRELEGASPSDAAEVALSVLEGALLLSRTHQRPNQLWHAGCALVSLLAAREGRSPTSTVRSKDVIHHTSSILEEGG